MSAIKVSQLLWALVWAMASGALAISPSLVAGCDPQAPSFGYGAAATLPTPTDDPKLGCGVEFPLYPNLGARESCTYAQGAMPSDSLGIDAATLATIPIRHVIIVMKENRSFDELFGMLNQEGQAGVDPIPDDYTNPNNAGVLVHYQKATNTCYPYDPNHQSASVAACVDGGKMDGFVQNAQNTTTTDGTFVMSYYDQTQLPFYYFLASTFAISQRHFAPLASGTYGSRNFMMFGSNAGVVDTGIVYPPPNTPSIMQLLDNAKYTWAAYTDGMPFSGALDLAVGDPEIYSLTDLYEALDQGTLPNVSFVDGQPSINDDHPDADLQAGEVWLKKIYDHAIKSPQWATTAMIYTYDEAGAFADHVVPGPNGCPATPAVSPFTALGPRVPLVMISPWARRNYVSNVPHDHTAITRFIEAVFNLPALTGRDANSDALLDLFDFSCGRDMSIATAPAPGTGGCHDPAPAGTD